MLPGLVLCRFCTGNCSFQWVICFSHKICPLIVREVLPNVARGAAFCSGAVIPHSWLETRSGGKKQPVLGCFTPVPQQDFLLPSLRGQMEPSSFASRHCRPRFLKSDPGGLELRILMLSFLLVRKMFPDGARQGKVGGRGGEHTTGERKR